MTNPLVWSLGKLKKKRKRKKKAALLYLLIARRRRWSVCQEIKVSKMWSCGGCLPPASGQASTGECVGVNAGSGLSAVAQLYRPSGTADMRRAATTAMTWWGTQGLYCHTTAIFIQHSLAYKLCACKHSFEGFFSQDSEMLPQWKPVHDPNKKRGMPTSCYPSVVPVLPQGRRGPPHNLLFVPLLLRKYFLNSSLAFVYFYCSYFLPWSNPVPSYLFAF